MSNSIADCKSQIAEVKNHNSQFPVSSSRETAPRSSARGGNKRKRNQDCPSREPESSTQLGTENHFCNLTSAICNLIASRREASYPASQFAATTHGQAFRAAPLHCGGRSHTSRQEHPGASSRRAAGRPARHRTGRQSLSQGFL